VQIADSSLLRVSFFAHLADADIADRTLQQHQRQELRHIAEGLEQRGNEIVNKSDPDSISFSPRWRNPGYQLQVNLVVESFYEMTNLAEGDRQ
jgi:hypothetical protein